MVQQSFRKLWSRSNSSPNTYRGSFDKSATSDDSGPLPLLLDTHLPLHLQLEKRCYYDFSNYDNSSCSSHLQKWLLVGSLFYWRCFPSFRHIHVLMQSPEQYCPGPQSHSCIRQQCWSQSFCICEKHVSVCVISTECLHFLYPNTWFW